MVRKKSNELSDISVEVAGLSVDISRIKDVIGFKSIPIFGEIDPHGYFAGCSSTLNKKIDLILKYLGLEYVSKESKHDTLEPRKGDDDAESNGEV